MFTHLKILLCISNIKSQLPLAFIIYTDIESFLQPFHDVYNIMRQLLIVIMLKVTTHIMQIQKVKIYKGENAIHHFLNALKMKKKDN